MSSVILAIWNILVLLAACYSPTLICTGIAISCFRAQKKKNGVIAVILATLFFAASSLFLWSICDFIMDW